MRVVDYKIHKYIASSAVRSLHNFYLLVVLRTCRWLLVQKTQYFKDKENSMRLTCLVISPSFHYFGLGHLRLFWINSQMALSSFQIRVLSTLTMLSFTLEVAEEYTGVYVFKEADNSRSENSVLDGPFLVWLFTSQHTFFLLFIASGQVSSR